MDSSATSQAASLEEFAKRKQRILKGLLAEDAADTPLDLNNKALESNTADAGSKPDKSLKRAVDALLVPICAFLNSHPDYVTTSCCSGRITAYQQAHTATGKRVKSGGRLVFVSHVPVDVSAASELLEKIGKGTRHYPDKKGGRAAEAAESSATLSHTDLKFEPLILHVEAATAASAFALLRAAVAAGLRESGVSAVGRRNLVAIRGSQRLEAPLTLGLAGRGAPFLGFHGVPSGAPPLGPLGLNEALAQPAGKAEEEALLVTPGYFSALLLLCNEKLRANERQIRRLDDTLRQQLAAPQTLQPPGLSSRQPAQTGGGPVAAAAADSSASCVSSASGGGSRGGSSAVQEEEKKDEKRDLFVGVREEKLLKAAKTALEQLGVFDKTRKMQQLRLEAADGGRGPTPLISSLSHLQQPLAECSLIKLLPVRGRVSLAALPQAVRGAVVCDPRELRGRHTNSSLPTEDEESLLLFSVASPPMPMRIRRNLAGCLDALLRAACEATVNGPALLQRAAQLRRTPVADAAAADAVAAANDNAGGGRPAAEDGPVVTWPNKFERLGDVILLPSGSLTAFNKLKRLGWETVGASQMAAIEAHLWRGLCSEFGARAVGLQAAISGRMRESRARLLFGSSGLTTVKEHGVLFTFDVTRCMFASGNASERLRFRKSILSSEGPPETVVDLFCGIGYFSLGALAFVPRERMEMLFACDINPTALQFFHMSLQQNRVNPDRVQFLLCDSCAPPAGPAAAADADAASMVAAVAASEAAASARVAIAAAECSPAGQRQCEEKLRAACVPAALIGKADRISLGLIPSSEDAWPTAVSLLNATRGGVLHVHGVGALEPLEADGLREAPSAVYVRPRLDSRDAAAGAANAAAAAAEGTDAVRPPNRRVGGNCKWGARLRFAQHALKEVAKLLGEKQGRKEGPWQVYIHHVEVVKSYAPKLYHFVVDLNARPLR